VNLLRWYGFEAEDIGINPVNLGREMDTNDWNLGVDVFDLNHQLIWSRLQEGHPTIVVYKPREKGGHFALIVGMDRQDDDHYDDIVYLANPRPRGEVLTWARFQSMWKRDYGFFGNRALRWMEEEPYQHVFLRRPLRRGPGGPPDGRFEP
jgi:hypothetical protein